MPHAQRYVVALLYPGDRAMQARADPGESRFAALFESFERAGVSAVPVVYNDDFADEVAAQLRGVDGVLVWCNPIEGGRRRDRLDTLLQEIADSGTFVSAHPDAVRRLGTKDVLVDCHDLPFGSDAVRVDNLAQLAEELPGRLRHGPRVLKQHRGHSGIGVWRVERIAGSTDLNVRHAQRGTDEERLDFDGLSQRLAPYFLTSNGGHMIDQAWQPRLAEGMVRAYLVADRVAGFGHQAINALYPARAGTPAPQPGPRLYHPATMPQFQGLRHKLETQWIELLRQRVELPPEQLPMLWDCDFLLGEPAIDELDRYVLCEINVSSVSPFPPSALEPLVDAVKLRLEAGQRRRVRQAARTIQE